MPNAHSSAAPSPCTSNTGGQVPSVPSLPVLSTNPKRANQAAGNAHYPSASQRAQRESARELRAEPRKPRRCDSSKWWWLQPRRPTPISPHRGNPFCGAPRATYRIQQRLTQSRQKRDAYCGEGLTPSHHPTVTLSTTSLWLRPWAALYPVGPKLGLLPPALSPRDQFPILFVSTPVSSS